MNQRQENNNHKTTETKDHYLARPVRFDWFDLILLGSAKIPPALALLTKWIWSTHFKIPPFILRRILSTELSGQYASHDNFVNVTYVAPREKLWEPPRPRHKLCRIMPCQVILEKGNTAGRYRWHLGTQHHLKLQCYTVVHIERTSRSQPGETVIGAELTHQCHAEWSKR